MAIKLAVAALILLAALGTFIATRPDRFSIERHALVQASPAVVFAMINDLRQFDAWSPYRFELAPGLSKSFEGPATGQGASYTWEGGSKAGAGRMTLVESRPSERVVLKLEFFKPFAATNQTVFTLAPVEGGTRVSWRMEGENTLMGKAFSLVVNMDTMLGKDFERGLANLDAAARSGTQADSQRAQAGTATPASAL
ncbi:SRPBCC family protein [Corallococcus terminator]|uniref:Polyketide cyclase n=1 Tax=Corallococcus terminator TaxID=2316733 RepID=A0A3A8J4B1_9BACT|nr:SRPBCC family protein [Corallococcus terminator]RKG90512.1 polyketide cyclase [Corallococcus terminator]